MNELGLPLGFAALLVAAPVVFALGLWFVWGKLREGGREDARWAAAALELGPGTQEFLSWDTRALRPWGHSNAVASFVVRARGEGLGWLEPVVVSLQERNPIGIRAVVGQVAGRGVAYVHCYGRVGSESRFVVQQVTGEALGVPDGGSSGAPPLDVRARLEAMAASAGEALKAS